MTKNKNNKNHKNKKDSNLIQVYSNTVCYFTHFDQSLIPKSILYTHDSIKPDQIEQKTNNCLIQVVNADTLDVALDCDFNKILILNMASNFKPGGGVLSGATAQEECIFRRTNAFMTHYSEWYPLQNNESIYSPEVLIIKDSNYELLPRKQQKTISVLSVPAVKNPSLIKDNYKNAQDAELMNAKIESIFQIAINHNHNYLILGALGCGAYRNPTPKIIEMFQKNIKKYENHFDQIIFAVLSSKGDINFELFNKAFSK